MKILDTKLLGTNHPSSELAVNLSSDGSSALITFDYLDKGQGAVIQIVHTGITSDDISLSGDIKGAKPLKKKRIRVYRDLPLPTPLSFDKRFKPATRRKIRALLSLFTGIVVLGVSIFSFLQPSVLQPTVKSNPSQTYQIMILAVGSVYFIAFLFMFFVTWSIHVPSGLEIIEEDLI